jgi:hypothetical protein
MGQKRRFDQSIDHFGSSPINGHSRGRSACRKGANMRHDVLKLRASREVHWTIRTSKAVLSRVRLIYLTEVEIDVLDN